MRSKNRQLLPFVNDRYIQIPGRQGSFLLPREITDRQIDIDCSFMGDDLSDLRNRARDIAAWLYTEERALLVFDDEPDKYYRGKIASAVDLDNVFILGKFRLSFICEPFAYSSLNSANFTNDTINIINTGTYQTPIIIEITFIEDSDEIKITKNNDYIRIVHGFVENDIVKIDTGAGSVFINGVRAMDKLDWQNSRFFDLTVGENVLNITPLGKCLAKVKYTPRWL